MRRLLTLSVLAMTPFLASTPAHAQGGACVIAYTYGTVIPNVNSGEFCTSGVLDDHWGYCYWEDDGLYPQANWHVEACWPMP